MNILKRKGKALLAYQKQRFPRRTCLRTSHNFLLFCLRLNFAYKNKISLYEVVSYAAVLSVVTQRSSPLTTASIRTTFLYTVEPITAALIYVKMARSLAALNEVFHPVNIVNIQIPELNSHQKPVIRKFVVDKAGSLLNWLRVLTRYFKTNNWIM